MGDRQKNKPFKKPGNFASKSEQKNRAKGKVDNKRESVKSFSRNFSKVERKHLQKQQIQAKRKALIEKKRLGTNEGAPKIVAIISLSGNVNQQQIRSLLIEASEADNINDSPFAVIPVQSQKQRLVVLDTPRISSAVIDAAKIADIVLFAMSAEQEPDSLGDSLVSLIKSQGVPSVIGCIQGLDRVPVKNQHEVRRSFTKHFHFLFPGEPKILPVDSKQDASQLLRFVCSIAVKPPVWRENRPYVIVQSCNVVNSVDQKSTLEIRGYLRGSSLSINNLLYIPSYGDFQIQKIESVEDPFPLKSHRDTENRIQLSEFLNLEKVDDLEEENPVEEIEDMDDTASVVSFRSTSKRVKKKVPKGTSTYQAAWIPDQGEEVSDDEESGDNLDALHSDEEMQTEDHEEKAEEEKEEEEELEDEESEEELEEFEDIPMDAEEIKREREQEDEMYPDEVDTPLDMPARFRFAKYRGLKSFRSSVWDPKENLPLDYGKIFQFQNFNRAKKRVLHEQFSSPIQAGMYVSITLNNFTAAESFVNQFEVRSSLPTIASGLLRYERKVSVLNFLVQKHVSYEEPVSSKDELILQCGFRTFRAKPIYSQFTPSCDKAKYERFLHPGQTVVATIYGPVMFLQSPVLAFKEEKDDDSGEILRLVATGSLHSVNPDRIIVKKVLLSAHPFKIHKRTVVARHMFFNPEDVRYFKPIELNTKLGRVGHMTEPLGTHGLMKCVFDGRIQPHDTIFLPLYKRIFPKWRATYT